MRSAQGRVEFGDFQTPRALAADVVALLASRGMRPRTVVEPACGLGSFVEASLTTFTNAAVFACDINPDYVRHTADQDRTSGRLTSAVINLFTHDWPGALASMPQPILIVGNPPWVTASGLGAIGGTNLPAKSNFQNRRGLDALTGKSNFDVAESILITLLNAARGLDATLAMLVKASVARRVLSHVWSTGTEVAAEMFTFDASAHFDVSAGACLFVCRSGRTSFECPVFELDRPEVAVACVGWRDGALVSDAAAYDRQRSLVATSASEAWRWRSGVKHDCSTVMELEHGRAIALESDYLYPLVKGTDLFHGRVAHARKWMLITQRTPGEDTSVIARRAPKTWTYLCANGDRLDARRSSIYRNRPRFSVFGVGPYTFAPWKVAVSALHKRPVFTAVGPIDGRPVVFDDTCYHLSCRHEREARVIASLLDSECARELLGALVFRDGKRPITSDILQRINLQRVALRLGRSAEFV